MGDTVADACYKPLKTKEEDNEDFVGQMKEPS